jgi:hypothetical protein
MHAKVGQADSMAASHATVRIATRHEVARLAWWSRAFAHERKDRRYYELLEDTLTEGFDYGYFVIARGEDVFAIQPYFLLDQDLLAGLDARAETIARAIRSAWPRFMRARTLMVGCSAGEGHLDGDDHTAVAGALAGSLRSMARELGCAMVVLKEFPAKYRSTLQGLQSSGFTRVPSMPLTKLPIAYENFDDYLVRRLSSTTRGTLRRKLRVSERAQPAITLSVTNDVSAIVDELYPLYLSVFERSRLQFEKLTQEFLRQIGTRMPDKVRFFVWRQDGRAIAFALCMINDGAIHNEYLGFDYAVAFKLHLYYRVFRDMIDWAIANGYKEFHSGSLNYDPKWHLRQELDPVDLYVRHVSDPVNAVFKRVLPLMEPTRSDKTLRNFPNYRELWD